MTTEYPAQVGADAVFVLDLRDCCSRPRPRRRRGFEAPALDGWTSNASPLDHFTMHGVGRDGWADHLLRCDNCAREQRRADRLRDTA